MEPFESNSEWALWVMLTALIFIAGLTLTLISIFKGMVGWVFTWGAVTGFAALLLKDCFQAGVKHRGL